MIGERQDKKGNQANEATGIFRKDDNRKIFLNHLKK